MTDWVWSEWITPQLVLGKANIAQANAGASVAIASDDATTAVDAVRGGDATGGSSLAAFGTPPYTYMSTGEVDADPFSTGYQATAYDRSSVILTTPPEASAALNVGYASGVWRERPELRQVPPEFYDLIQGVDWVPIDSSDFTWAGKVEFEPDVDTVGVRWADLSLVVSGESAGVANEVSGNVGYSPSVILPSTGSAWTGSFGSWPPPLGAQIARLDASTSLPVTVPMPVTPPAGSDFTIVSYTDMAVSGYSPNDEWQQWTVRPVSTDLGEPLYIWHQMPRYRYRIPKAALSPRFFVKHQDDSMRPVGFGKPATELTVLRVPGGGRWRDLTAAEYATYGPTVRPPGGMTLKVKRLDAGGSVWWDQVGWMVPDS